MKYFEFKDMDSNLWDKYPGLDIYDAAESYAVSRDDEGYLSEGGEITCSARETGADDTMQLRITAETYTRYHIVETGDSPRTQRSDGK